MENNISRNAGTYVVNDRKGSIRYESFRPTDLPIEPPVEITGDLMQNLINANKAFDKLRTAISFVADSEAFLYMLLCREAMLSSAIDGKTCDLEDFFDPEIFNAADKGREYHFDWNVIEVMKSINALYFAVENHSKLPLGGRFFRQIHKVWVESAKSLIRNDDAGSSIAGEYRRSQVWIGEKGCTIKDAVYIPPNPEDVKECMYSFEKYINSESDYDPIVNAALLHYQFETIHPFNSGNGVIGRIMTLLYLMEQGVISGTSACISLFLGTEKEEYFNRLQMVHDTGDYDQWIIFFIKALEKAAEDSISLIKDLSLLNGENRSMLPINHHKKDSTKAVYDYLLVHPIIDIGQTAKSLKMSWNTASSAIKRLESYGVLKERTSALRNRVYAYEDYLKIIKRGL